MFRGLVSRRRQRLSFTIICSNDAAAARPKHTAAKISTALTAATCLQADLRREPIIRKLPHCIDRRFSGPERGLTWIRSIRTHANTMSHGSNGSVEGHSEVLALSRKVNNFYLDGKYILSSRHILSPFAVICVFIVTFCIFFRLSKRFE